MVIKFITMSVVDVWVARKGKKKSEEKREREKREKIEKERRENISMPLIFTNGHCIITTEFQSKEILIFLK